MVVYDCKKETNHLKHKSKFGDGHPPLMTDTLPINR